MFCLARWYTSDADVTVLPVPGCGLRKKGRESGEAGVTEMEANGGLVWWVG